MRTNMFPSGTSSRFNIRLSGCVCGFFLATKLAFEAHGATVDSQVEALLGRMTLEEKVGQMVQVDSGALTNRADVGRYFLGSVLSGGSSDPVAGNSPQAWLDLEEGFQAEAL